MKAKLCGYAGCKCITDGSYYCPTHKALQQKRKEQYQKEHPMSLHRGASSEYNSWYRSPRWRYERKIFLKEHPYCYLCGAEAKIVDHAIAHKGNEELFWNHSNWQPMCMSCHSAKTLRENKFFKKY